MRINLTPPAADLETWGTLAYVSAQDRKTILGKPFGETKVWIKSVAREVRRERKKQEKALKRANAV